MHHSKLVLLTILFTTTRSCNGFIAYDCNGPRLNITSFNTIAVDHCTPPTPTTNLMIPKIKLIQRSEIQMLMFQSCYITVDYLVTRCSLFDDAQVVQGGYFTDIVQLGRSRCAMVHEKHFYELSTGGIIGDLRVNNTNVDQRTIAGIIDNRGNCEGVTFTWGEHTWHSVVVQAKYRIHLYEGAAMANYRENQLTLPGGTILNLDKQYGMDSHKGEIIWTSHKDNCENEEFDVLYEGPATQITNKGNYEYAPETHTYLVELDKIAFALKKVKRAFACDVPVVQTEHPQLFIVTDETFFSRFQIRKISPYNTDLLAYVNNKFVYIENLLRTTTTSLYADLMLKQCKIERDVLLQKLAISTYSLVEFAYIMGGGPGHTAIKSGEVVYLLKCKPVDVELKKQKSCFNELPVSYKNKTYFMAPKTHTLQQYGTQITCNELLPSAFALDGDWFGLTPELRELKPPQTLKPSIEWTWSYNGPEYLMNTGLYSPEVMHALQRHIMFPQEAEAAQKNLARHSMGYDLTEQNIRLKPYFDEQAINRLIENKLDQVWGWLVGFGNVVSGVVGLIFIWKIMIQCLNTCLNVAILYQTFGWSVKLIAGLWSSLTHFIMHKKHQGGPNSQQLVEGRNSTKYIKPLYPSLRRLSV